MSECEFNRIAAEIRDMSREAKSDRMWAAIQGFAHDATASTMIVFLRTYGEIVVSGGAATITFDGIANATGLTWQIVGVALDLLRREGLILVDRLDRRTWRVTMPCLVTKGVLNTQSRSAGECESRLLH